MKTLNQNFFLTEVAKIGLNDPRKEKKHISLYSPFCAIKLANIVGVSLVCYLNGHSDLLLIYVFSCIYATMKHTYTVDIINNATMHTVLKMLLHFLQGAGRPEKFLKKRGKINILLTVFPVFLLQYNIPLFSLHVHH
jgi:hypothetical protein